ncbi:MAG TPA: CbtB-domain containing protein [Stellaceae bacterium]|nr:CbtB-domain containing protein [Stellaceae bacterium]
MTARTAPLAGTRGLAAALPAVMALLVGAFLVLAAGFSPIAVIHNATHDARHAMFPCH